MATELERVVEGWSEADEEKLAYWEREGKPPLGMSGRWVTSRIRGLLAAAKRAGEAAQWENAYKRLNVMLAEATDESIRLKRQRDRAREALRAVRALRQTSAAEWRLLQKMRAIVDPALADTGEEGRGAKAHGMVLKPGGDPNNLGDFVKSPAAGEGGGK